MIYLDDLPSPMIFSPPVITSSLPPTPSKILYTPKKAEVNTADQVPDPVGLYFCWLDTLISMALLMYGISIKETPGSLLQISMYPSQDVIILRQKKKFWFFDSFFFHLTYLDFQISCESDILFHLKCIE